MKKIFLTVIIALLFQCGAYAITEDIAVKTFTNEKGLWGLKDTGGMLLLNRNIKS